MNGDWVDYRVSQLRREKALRDAEVFRLTQRPQDHRSGLSRVLRLTRILSLWL